MASDPIGAFWAWWPSVAGTIARGFRDGGLSDDLVEAVSAHVRAIDERLDWEFGPGERSEHHLCLSGKGDPTLRVIAERWRKRAPAPDATWEFFASRQGAPEGRGGFRIKIADLDVALDDFQVALTPDETRERLDLELHHPALAAVSDADLKLRIAFIALDNALGEDDVERWLGAIELGAAPRDGAVPLPELRAAVDRFAENATGDRWAVLRGTKDGQPIFVTTNMALKRIDHLLLDTHVEIAIPLASPTPEGLTTEAEADVLNRIEDELGELLGDDAVFVGRETGFGKRILHWHVMEGGPAASIVARWKARHAGYAMQVAVRPDLRWEILDRWR